MKAGLKAQAGDITGGLLNYYGSNIYILGNLRSLSGKIKWRMMTHGGIALGLFLNIPDALTCDSALSKDETKYPLSYLSFYISCVTQF